MNQDTFQKAMIVAQVYSALLLHGDRDKIFDAMCLNGEIPEGMTYSDWCMDEALKRAKLIVSKCK